MITRSKILPTSRRLDPAKVHLVLPLFTAQLEPIGKLFNLPFSTEMSIDLWTRKPGTDAPKERGNL